MDGICLRVIQVANFTNKYFLPHKWIILKVTTSDMETFLDIIWVQTRSFHTWRCTRGYSEKLESWYFCPLNLLCDSTAAFLFCVSRLHFFVIASKHVIKSRTRRRASVVKRDRSRGRVIWIAHDHRSPGHFDSFKSRWTDGHASCEKRYLVKWGFIHWDMYLKLRKT
jgi:hypothetical protein